MEVTGTNLEYLINEAKKMYSEYFNKWLIDTVDKNKLDVSTTALTVYNCPGTSKADYKLIDKVNNAIISNLQIECNMVERDK